MTFRERVEDSYLDTNLDDDKWWQDGGLYWLLHDLELDFGKREDCGWRIEFAIILNGFHKLDVQAKIKVFKALLTPVLDTNY